MIIRVIDKELYEFVKTLPCVSCGELGPSDAHHIKTRKSGGGDEVHNLISLCRECHSMCHQLGLTRFVKLHPSVENWLLRAGWVFEDNKWRYFKKEEL